MPITLIAFAFSGNGSALAEKKRNPTKGLTMPTIAEHPVKASAALRPPLERAVLTSF